MGLICNSRIFSKKMIVAGIDAGANRVKAVILGENRMLGAITLDAGKQSATQAITEAVSQATAIVSINISTIDRFAITGKWRSNAPFATREVSDSLSLARGINWFLPSVRTVLDIGSQKTLAVSCVNGVPFKSQYSDRCAAGNGQYLEMVAEILGVNIDELGKFSLEAESYIELQNVCTVFAESEIITLVHENKGPREIARGAHRGLAQRLYPLLLSVGIKPDIAIVGGISKNVCLVRELEELIGEQLMIPSSPDIVSALGAGLVAYENASE